MNKPAGNIPSKSEVCFEANEVLKNYVRRPSLKPGSQRPQLLSFNKDSLLIETDKLTTQAAVDTIDSNNDLDSFYTQIISETINNNHHESRVLNRQYSTHSDDLSIARSRIDFEITTATTRDHQQQQLPHQFTSGFTLPKSNVRTYACNEAMNSRSLTNTFSQQHSLQSTTKQQLRRLQHPFKSFLPWKNKCDKTAATTTTTISVNEQQRISTLKRSVEGDEQKISPNSIKGVELLTATTTTTSTSTMAAFIRQSSLSPEDEQQPFKRKKKKKTASLLSRIRLRRWIKSNRTSCELTKGIIGYQQELIQQSQSKNGDISCSSLTNYSTSKSSVIDEFRRAIESEFYVKTVEDDNLKSKCYLVAEYLDIISQWLTDPQNGNTVENKTRVGKIMDLMQAESSHRTSSSRDDEFEQIGACISDLSLQGGTGGESRVSSGIGTAAGDDQQQHDLPIRPLSTIQTITTPCDNNLDSSQQVEDLLLRRPRVDGFQRTSLQSTSLRMRHNSDCSSLLLPTRNSQPELDIKTRHYAFDTSPLNKKMRSKGKLYKQEVLNLESVIELLCRDCASYESFEKQMKSVIHGRSPGRTWREVSLLFYVTRKLVRRETASRAKQWEEYCMEYFTRHLCEWVQQQGGFDVLLELSTDSELD